MSIINVNVNENNYTRDYTAETEINSLKLTAPMVNLLPYNNYKNYCKPINLDGTYTNLYGSYHFDFRDGLSYHSGRRLLDISKIYNITDLKPGIYTVCLKVDNINGTYNLGDIPCYREYKEIGNDTVVAQNIGSINVSTKERIYNLVFTVGENQFTTSFDFGCNFLTWSTVARDLSFNLTFIGLFNGELSVKRPSDKLGESPEVIIENSKNIIGEYEISTNIQRHLKQIERHITAQDDKFTISFRQ